MVKPAGDGISLLYTSILLLVLGWSTILARFAVRINRKAVGLDDYVMLVGVLLFTVTAGLCITCVFFGSGQYSSALTASEKMHGVKLFFIAEFFYGSGAVAIKCSIAVTLLRIADTRRRFVWSIWIIIAASVISALIFIITIANICHPITTLWGETTTGSCNLKLNSDISLFFSALEIATDWALAILPALLLWSVQMKTRVKISVGLILGLAAFASCATIVRLRYLSLYSDPNEFMYGTGKIGLWSIIEEGIGIFAGSLPALRPLLSMSCLGFKGTSNDSSNPNSNLKYNQPRTKRTRSDIKLDTFHELADVDKDVDFDGDSQKYILKETRVTIISNERGAPPGDWEKGQVLGWKKNNNNSGAAF